MSIRDKLDAAWLIATTIGFSEQTGEVKTLSQTADEYGALLEECPESELFLSLLEGSNPTIDDLLAVLAALSSQLHGGFYRSEQ